MIFGGFRDIPEGYDEFEFKRPQEVDKFDKDNELLSEFF